MSNSPFLISQLSSKRGWKPTERISNDAPPSILVEEQGSSSDRVFGVSEASNPGKTTDIVACSVCQKHQSRYTCPRCQAPYCCVDCYRSHTRSNSGNVSTDDFSSSPCTEEFYKNRVSSLLNFEAKENKDDTHRLLNQHYQQTILERGEAEDSEVDLSDQMYEMLQLLDERTDDNLTQEEVMAIMPAELKAAFQRDIQEGKLQELMLERWHPWWRRQFVSSGDSADFPAHRSTGTTKTLDERLLEVPKLTTLTRKHQSSQVLLFHVIEILYSFCWSLRLYHGLPNVIGNNPRKGQVQLEDDDLVIDTAATLLQHSAVLRDDARYSSLEQVLSACTSTSTKYLPNGCNAEWTVLVEDCALILTSHRLVGRALLEAMDLLKAAIQCFKRTDDSSMDGESNKENSRKLRQFRKKLEFFLSWSQYAKEQFGDATKRDLMDWIQTWNSYESAAGDGASNEAMERLQIPHENEEKHSPSAGSSKDAPPPLFVELSTKHREA